MRIIRSMMCFQSWLRWVLCSCTFFTTLPWSRPHGWWQSYEFGDRSMGNECPRPGTGYRVWCTSFPLSMLLRQTSWRTVYMVLVHSRWSVSVRNPRCLCYGKSPARPISQEQSWRVVQMFRYSLDGFFSRLSDSSVFVSPSFVCSVSTCTCIQTLYMHRVLASHVPRSRILLLALYQDSDGPSSRYAEWHK